MAKVTIHFHDAEGQEIFKEEQHPRDPGGKFAKTGASGGAPSGGGYVINSAVANELYKKGFKKQKGQGLTYKGPNGLTVIVHPPEPGLKSSSKWESQKEGKEAIQGFGAGKLSTLLNRAIEQQVNKKTPTKIETLAAGFGYKLEDVDITAGNTIGKYVKPDGSYVQEVISGPNQGSWFSGKPGKQSKSFLTSKLLTSETAANSLSTMLGGEYNPNHAQPWQNHSEKVSFPAVLLVAEHESENPPKNKRNHMHLRTRFCIASSLLKARSPLSRRKRPFSHIRAAHTLPSTKA